MVTKAAGSMKNLPTNLTDTQREKWWKKPLTPAELLGRMIIDSLPNFIVSVSPAGSRAFITLCSGVRKKIGGR